MNLGTKTLIGLGASFAIWCLLTFAAMALLLRPSFDELERKNLERNCERARQAIADQADNLCAKVGDWALWDDTYEFITTRDPAYVTANLNPESLVTLDLDFMVFLDTAGRLVQIALRSEDVGGTITAAAVAELLATRPRLLAHDGPKSSHRGLLDLHGTLLLLASRPIHRSDLSGSARGCMIAGRIVDDEAAAKLARLTQLDLTVHPEQQRDATVITTTDEEIAGSIALRDVFGAPVAVCRVRMQRDIHREGESALRLLLAALLICSGLALLTALAGVDTFVLRRLRALHSTMCEITRTGDLSRQVHVHGNDEIRELGESLNDLTRSLHQAQRKLIAANEARSQFLANVSHEVRTPVTAVLGFTDLLQDPTVPPAQREDFVQTIRRNAQHLLTILNDLLDTAKIESGQMTVELVPTALPELLLDSLALVQPAAAKKNLAVQVELATRVPTTIRTDPTRLRQILANLLGNAAKFTSAGSVRMVVAMHGPEVLCIDVVDTGIGIPPEHRPRLFQPFVQADASTSRRFGGTGLGLALSRHLARSLGGDLTLTSSGAEGSTFRLTAATGSVDGVPTVGELRRSPGRATPPTPMPDRPLDGRRVLVVDDAADNRRLVSYVLGQAGAAVDLAENGREAVDRVHAAGANGAPYDLVVMDMQMPVLDGYGATIELRNRGCTMPILALTANAMQSDLEACLGAGCTNYATKPIDRKGLVAVVGSLLVPPDA